VELLLRRRYLLSMTRSAAAILGPIAFLVACGRTGAVDGYDRSVELPAGGEEAVAEPSPSRTRTPPATMPAALSPPPDPTAKLPAGTPEVEGRISHILAIDAERAIVRFIIPGRRHAEKWWLALMHADGSLGWVRTMADDVAENEHSHGLERIGDAVSIITSRMVKERPVLTMHAFALADGSPRYEVELGHGYLNDTATAGELRVDARVDYVFTLSATLGSHIDAELIVSGPKGVRWRAPIGEPIPVGHDPTIVGDVIAVRNEERGGTRWLAFDRSSGAKRGEFVGDPQSCSDGRRWLVRRGDELIEIDLRSLKTKVVMGPSKLAKGSGAWSIVDCVFADATPIVLLGRGPRNALAALDPATMAIAGHVEIGTNSVGMNGFDPLPQRARGVLVLQGLARDGEHEVVVADPKRSRELGRWRGQTSYLPQLFDGGWLLTTASTIFAVDAKTGELEGRAMLGIEPPQREQIAGASLWVAREPMKLGRRAPWVIALDAKVSDDVRDAVLAEMQSTEQLAAKAGRRPCPDPREVVRGDGLGTDGKLGPVALTRLPTWDLDVLRETARTLACAPADAPARLLAWYVMEDNRPLRNDNALLLVEHSSSSSPRYTLVSVYRHATNREWNTAGSFHDPTEPVRTFDHRPTRKEIDAFLAQADWTFADGWGRVIAGNVLDDEWRAATGAAPWHAFPKGIEQAD
jgi:hypothetical protein